MFEELGSRMNKVFRDLAGFGKISAENVTPALREIRVALLEADVHFKVVKEFLEAVKVRALGVEVTESIRPADEFVKIVRDELAKTLGGGTAEPISLDPTANLKKSRTPPTKILLCGLQGAGKTTAASKLAKLLGAADTALVALDLKRPAAIEQLRVLAEQTGSLFIPPAFPQDAPKSARAALEAVREKKYAIFDSAGRLQVDEDLMAELKEVSVIIAPDESVLVLDAMTGQEAVKVAQAFHDHLELSSIYLSKTDGDARGGAALSVRHVTGLPIKWVGTGERPDAIETFHPTRFADRILGMGDVVSLVERAQRMTDQDKVEKLGKRMLQGELDLEMFLEQMREVRKMGPLQELLGLLPGGSQLAPMAGESEKELGKFEAMILSMTPKERRHPELIEMSRRARIARGAGVKGEDIARMLKKFRQTRQVFHTMMGKGRQSKLMRKMLGNFGGGA